jgi:uncharacterized protein YdeI (YjbR/CyaY-like superfamily)
MPLRIPDERYVFEDGAAWRAWLQANQASVAAAWLVIAKSHVTTGLHYEAAIEEALCFGWIDGVMKSLDADGYLLRFSPRRAGSVWSLSNRRRVEKLVAEGRMTEAGLEKVRIAQGNGAWEQAVQRDAVTDPTDDLAAALQANPVAQANFMALAPTYKRQFRYWIDSAKTAPTRLKRVQAAVELLAQGKRMGQS